MVGLEKLKLEVCVESIEEAIVAEKKGAYRVELCSDLSNDGLTPPREIITEAFNTLRIPIKVMVRPRSGDFVYSNSEFEQMISDIRFCRELGIKEIATGILTSEYTMDIRRLEVLGSIASPLTITIHKCIDRVNDIREELEKLKTIPQVQSILTSGQKETALEGKAKIKELITLFGDRFSFIPAGKITPLNLPLLHRELDVQEYHGRNIL